MAEDNYAISEHYKEQIYDTMISNLKKNPAGWANYRCDKIRQFLNTSFYLFKALYIPKQSHINKDIWHIPSK